MDLRFLRFYEIFRFLVVEWLYGFSSLILRRTVLEDLFLRKELEGYAEYAQKTRYCLIPGIW